MFTISDNDTNARLELDDVPYVVIYEKDAPELPIVITNANNSINVDFRIDSLIDVEKANRNNLLKELSSQKSLN